MVIFPLSQLWTQQVVQLDNPSFEDFPHHSTPPIGWTDCGFAGETPPDVQPSGQFGVFWPAMHGNTYLGMVTRETETYESVGQRLNGILWAGTCYQISFFLCKSPVYFSVVDIGVGNEKNYTSTRRNFVTPIKLRIWGGNDMCNKEELLGETGLVTNNEWEKYYLKLSPTRGNYRYIFLEAYYETPSLFAYNGNVLIDDASDIVALENCEDEIKEDMVAAPEVQIIDPVEKIDASEMLYRLHARIKNVDSPERVFMAVNDYEVRDFKFNVEKGEFTTYLKLSPGRNIIKIIGSNQAGTDTDSTFIRTIDPLADVNKVPEPVVNRTKPPSSDEEIIDAKDYDLANTKGEKSLKKGDIINLDHLQFKTDRSELSEEDKKILDELFRFMRDYPQIHIEIGGHTNGIPDSDYCKKISQARAREVKDYLVNRGINARRLISVGYGKKYPIATNSTPEGRKRNQRVEIKILKTSM